MHTWDDLAGLALARQFPAPSDDVAGMLERVGPVQSQTARSPFLGLAARFPGVTREAITAAYEVGAIVRGSTIRGTVHTATPSQYAALGVATRTGQRVRWVQLLSLQRSTPEQLWEDIEEFARDWRTPDELRDHLHRWLMEHEGLDEITEQQIGRYLAFSHGGLVRRPVNGNWTGQGAPLYKTLAPTVPATAADAIRWHLRCHGPSSRHDVAWWSGLGLRLVDTLLDRMDLVAEEGPDGRTYLDLSDPPAPRTLRGVHLLPEFDALMCGYDPPARERFADPAHLRRLWSRSNGLVLPPLLVDGRITGYWRATGSSTRRPLEVVWFAGTRKPRKPELTEPVAALEAGLGITVTAVTLSREVV